MLLKEARDGFWFDCECRHLAKDCIMALKMFKEYKGRPMGQDILNRKLQIVGEWSDVRTGVPDGTSINYSRE